MEATTLSSSEFAASNNKAHLVKQDQNNSITSRYEGNSARETLDGQGMTMSLCTEEDLQQHFGGKNKDVVKRLGGNLLLAFYLFFFLPYYLYHEMLDYCLVEEIQR